MENTQEMNWLNTVAKAAPAMPIRRRATRTMSKMILVMEAMAR